MAQNCPCPADALLPGSDYVGVDYIDGYPAEYGEFTFDIADFGFDRGTANDADIRHILGLPADGGSSGEQTMLFKLGSGIKVDKNDPQWRYHKGYRLDCGCLQYTCDDGTGTAPDVSETLSCISDWFVDELGNFDSNCDQIRIVPTTILRENFGVHEGITLNGTIPNLMFFDPDITNTNPALSGIPTNGSFTNFIDDYGIIYAAFWKITDNQIDITFMTQDPRIPGEPDAKGKIVKYKNGFRVYKRGVTTITRQIIVVEESGVAIIGQGTTQEVGEFKATFGCEDEPVGDPFYYHIDHNITDQVEFLTTGTDLILQDPIDQDSADFVWWPTTLTGTEGEGFHVLGPDMHPLTIIDVDDT